MGSLGSRAPETGQLSDALELLMSTESGIIDFFVIGGGINGAGFVHDAAGHGLRVCPETCS
jgi:hypothetical protein